MFKKFKWSFSNILSLLVIVILILPQTRQPIQLQVQKLFAKIAPSIQPVAERQTIENFDWSLIDLNGNTYNLNHTQGKIKLISFWATWCPPCVAELPSLQKLYDSYKNDVEFVFISNEKPSVVKAFMTKNSFNFPVYIPLEAAKEIYFKPRTIPRTLLIDYKNEIIMIEDGASNWNSEKVRNAINTMKRREVVY